MHLSYVEDQRTLVERFSAETVLAVKESMCIVPLLYTQRRSLVNGRGYRRKMRKCGWRVEGGGCNCG